MGRPRMPDSEVTPGALLKRKQRERMRNAEMGEFIELAPGESLPPPVLRLAETARLVLKPVWIPKGDEKAIEFAAQRLRKAARIPESEVPDA